jgi:hypothetical protein
MRRGLVLLAISIPLLALASAASGESEQSETSGDGDGSGGRERRALSATKTFGTQMAHSGKSIRTDTPFDWAPIKKSAAPMRSLPKF